MVPIGVFMPWPSLPSKVMPSMSPEVKSLIMNASGDVSSIVIENPTEGLPLK